MLETKGNKNQTKIRLEPIASTYRDYDTPTCSSPLILVVIFFVVPPSEQVRAKAGVRIVPRGEKSGYSTPSASLLSFMLHVEIDSMILR